MANYNITLKRNNAGTYDNLYPKTTWDQVESKPSTFTPTAHTHTLSDITDSGAAAAYAVVDSASPTAISTGTSLTTERDVYYGLVAVNGASQTRATTIYAPTSAGTSGQVLTSTGGTPTWQNASGGGATYSSATLYIKRIYSRTADSAATWTERYDAGTGSGTSVSTTSTFTSIALGYTPASTEQFMIEFSTNTNNGLEKGICIVGHGTFSSTAGMSVISYDAYETVDSGQLKIAKYFAQWSISTSNINFRYGSKLVW